MGELLLFNIQDPEKKTAIRLTALRLGLRCREILPERQGETLEALLSGAAANPAQQEGEREPFADELMLMHALTQAEFHELLDTLRREGQSIRLKAVVTEHNRKWTAQRLHRELCAEEEAMKRWKQQTQNKRHKKK